MRRIHRCVFWYDWNGERISFQAVDGFLIEYPQGVDSIAMSFTEGNAPDGIGSTAWDSQVPARPVTITGYVIAKPADKHVRQLHRVFAPHNVGRLYAQDVDGNIWWLECRVASAPGIESGLPMPRFLLQLRADYPYWQQEEPTVISAAGEPAILQADIWADVPVLFRAVIRILSGNAESITIAADTGEMLRYGGAVGRGQQLTIFTDARGRVRCQLDGQSVINAVTGGLRKIKQGKRTITVFCGAGVTAEADLTYWEALSGV